MLSIWYTQIDRQLTGALWQDYLSQVPQPLQAKIGRFRRWEDAHLSLFGKLLLVRALQDWGYSADLLSQLRYSDYQRPELPETGLDFNITHSGNVVACALTKGQKIGIDVEEPREIDIADFKNIWRPDEWEAITSASDRFAVFYHLWTCKEAVIKADGKGMSIPLADIKIGEGEAFVHEERWYLQPVELAAGYPAHLASDQELPTDPPVTRVAF